MWRARILGLGAAILCLLAIGSAIFGYIKQQAARTAERHSRTAELEARRAAYDSDMNMASQALTTGNIGRVRDLLEAHRPTEGRKDLRGWEWRYLWAQTRGNALETVCKKPYEINSLAVSSDGRWLAIGEVQQGGVSIWDLSAKKEVYHFLPDASGTIVAFSPVGTLLAYASSSDTGIRLFDVATGRTVGELKSNESCGALAFSRDGHELVTASSNEISLWSVPSGGKLGSYPIHGLLIPAVCTRFSVTPDLTHAAFASMDGSVHVIDLRTGALVWTVAPAKGVFGFFTTVAISPDGSTLAIGHAADGGQIRLWDVATHRTIGATKEKIDLADELVFSGDGKRLISASTDQTIRVWNVATQACEKIFRGHRSEVWHVALFPDEHTLVSGGKDGVVCLWDSSSSPGQTDHLTLDARVRAWRFGSGPQTVFTLDDAGNVARWFGPGFGRREVIVSAAKVNSIPTGFPTFNFSGAWFSRDLHWLALGGTKGEVTIWDLQRQERARSFVVPGGEPTGPLGFFAGDSRLLLLQSGSPPRMIVWDLASGRETQSWPSVMGPFPHAYALLPDEKSCVMFGQTGSVVRNLAGQRTESSGRFEMVEGSNAALSPNGRHLAASSYYGLVRIFDVASGRTEASLTDFRHSALGAAYSPDGELLVVTSLGIGVRLWDTNNWSETLTLNAGQGSNDVAFSPDGNCIGVLTGESLQIWQAPSWEEIRRAERGTAR